MNAHIYLQYIQERHDLYLPIIQPLQYAKGWKRDGFLSMADLKSCFEKTCLSHPGEGIDKDSIYKKIFLSANAWCEKGQFILL